MTDTKHAAIVVVHDGHGRYLSVSRHGNPHDIGFPGGHVEEGEEPAVAAIRELAEETGILGMTVEHVFDAPRPNGEGNLSVYRATHLGASELRPEPGETVRWAHPHEFSSPSCSFADFARTHAAKLFAARDTHTLDLAPSSVHTDSLGGMRRATPADMNGPVTTPAFAQPTPPKRSEIIPVPRWPLTQRVNMISAAKRASLPSGKFALPAQKKYPIDTAARVRNAAARLEQNKGRLSPEDYAKAKGAIGRAASKFGIHSEYNKGETKASDAPATAALVPHMHVQAIIPHGGSLHVRHLTDEGGGEFVDTLTLADVPEDGPVWNQVACVGAFKGHPAGPFELNDSVFSEIVSNWERGGRKPIPVDYEHASEADATAGNIPIHGAPAQGWITDLSNRGADGLFGKIEWLPQARAQIRAGQYKFFSPAIRFGARDKVSGRPIGARLTSGALTNQPFLDNLAPIKARAPQANLIAARDDGAPMTTEQTHEQTVAMAGYADHHFVTPSSEYMPKIKACMGLHALATCEEMKDHLDRLRGHLEAAGGNVNATVNGVSLGSFIHPLREMTYGAGAHATTAEQIFDAVEHMIDAAIAEHVAEDHPGETAATMAGYGDTTPAVAADDTGEADMATMKDLETENTTLKINLADKTSEVTTLKTKVEGLEKWKAEREEAELASDVECALSEHSDRVATLGDDDDSRRKVLLKFRTESPEVFARQFPRANAAGANAYLLRTVTPPAPTGDARQSASATGIPEIDPIFANDESVSDTATRLMSEQKLSYAAAAEQALNLHHLARSVAEGV